MNHKIAILKILTKFTSPLINTLTIPLKQNTGSHLILMVLTELNSNPQELAKVKESNLTLPTSSLIDLPQDRSEWISQRLILNSQKVKIEETMNKLSENCLSSFATQLILQFWKMMENCFPMSKHTQEMFRKTDQSKYKF